MKDNYNSENKEIRDILEHLVAHFASKDEDGNWWGFDTNLGNREPDIRAAINSINGQNLWHRKVSKKQSFKYYKDVGWLDREAIAKSIWKDKIPKWWKGSRAEWEVLSKIGEATK